MRRRFLFTTPFVIVVGGCGGAQRPDFSDQVSADVARANAKAAAEREEAERREREEAPRRRARERDEAARENAQRLAEVERDCRTGRASCNPPRPEPKPPEPPPADNKPTANPPSPFVRVLAVDVQGDATIVRFDRGKRFGVARDWRAQIVNADGRPLPGGDCVLVRVDDTTSICKTKLTVDQVRTYRLRIGPR